MNRIALIGSLAAVLAAMPLSAQNNKFRTGDINAAARARVEAEILRQQQAQQSQDRRTRDQQNRGPGKIPPGQMPPAGMCRIWIDGVPPGRQPAPTDCQTAVATRPANARVIWGDQTAFPGKGKGKFDKNRGHHDDDDFDDDDDDRVQPRTNRGSVIGAAIPRANVQLKSSGKSSGKGKGHGGPGRG